MTENVRDRAAEVVWGVLQAARDSTTMSLSMIAHAAVGNLIAAGLLVEDAAVTVQLSPVGRWVPAPASVDRSPSAPEPFVRDVWSDDPDRTTRRGMC